MSSTPAEKRTLSARHARHAARIEPQPRRACPDGLPLSTSVSVCANGARTKGYEPTPPHFFAKISVHIDFNRTIVVGTAAFGAPNINEELQLPEYYVLRIILFVEYLVNTTVGASKRMKTAVETTVTTTVNTTVATVGTGG